MTWFRGHRRGNKYGAVAVKGFASKKEAAYFDQLKLLKIAGAITNLEVHPRFPLVVNGIKVGTYTPDFRYTEDGKSVVVEVKGYRTEAYALRVKVFKALYPELIFKEV